MTKIGLSKNKREIGFGPIFDRLDNQVPKHTPEPWIKWSDTTPIDLGKIVYARSLRFLNFREIDQVCLTSCRERRALGAIGCLDIVRNTS